MSKPADCDHLQPTTQNSEISMAYPNLKQAIWLLVLFTLIQVILVVLAAAAGRWLFESEFLSVILLVVSFIIILRYVYRRADLTWKDISQSFNVDFDWRVWPCVTISIVGMAMVLFELDKALVRIMPMPEWVQDTFHSAFGRETSFSSALLYAVIVGPLVEEVLHRRIILSGLLANYNAINAFVWSAVLFGVFHLIPWQIPGALLGGLLLAWWVIRTGSLLPALFGHVLNNIIGVAYLHFEIPYFAVSKDLNVVVFNPWWWSAAGAVIAAIGLSWFYLVTNGRQPVTPDGVVAPDGE